MAQRYMLIPLPEGIFRGYDLTTRAVLGALYDRVRLSNYNLIGDPAGEKFYDPVEEKVYCIYTHDELGRQLGVSEKTVRLQYSCLENLMNSLKRQNERILKEELPRLVDAQYATGDQWRNNSTKNEETSQSKNNTQLWM